MKAPKNQLSVMGRAPGSLASSQQIVAKCFDSPFAKLHHSESVDIFSHKVTSYKVINLFIYIIQARYNVKVQPYFFTWPGAQPKECQVFDQKFYCVEGERKSNG